MTKDNLDPLLDARDNIVTKDEEKAKILMSSLPQSSVELVLLWVRSPQS